MIEIEERLGRYRAVLDEAIAERIDAHATDDAIASFEDAAAPSGNVRRWWLVAAAAVVAIVGGFAIVAEREPSSVVPAERPADVDPPPAPTTRPAPTQGPATTTGPTTTGPTDEPTAVAAPIEALAIGDSVMQGAAGQLAEAGFTVDATESRAFVHVVDVVETLGEQRRLGDTVVVHAGTNGPIHPEELDRVATALADVPNVVFTTISLPEAYTYANDNNALIRALPDRWPRVVVFDWAELVDACPGACLYDDHIHLRPDGQTYYAGLIRALTGRLG